MKKNIALPAIIVLIIITCTIFISDGLTYLVASLMALAIIGIIQYNKPAVMKMTRWAKANPKKAQLFIIVVQIVLMAMGIFAGNNFKEMGYELSNTTAYVFSAIIAIGFATVHFLPSKKTIAIPQEVNKNRLVYSGIALSSFVMMIFFGNRVGEMYPNSPITHAIRSIDRAIFADNANVNDAAMEPEYSINYNQALTDESSSQPVFASFSVSNNETIKLPAESKKDSKANLKAERKANKLEKKKARLMNHLKSRMAAAGGMGVGAILLIILLVITTCAGICLLISGFGGGGAGAVIGGAAIAVGSIWGIIKIIKKNKRKNT